MFNTISLFTDSTLGKRKIVIGMLHVTAGMMNKQIVRHFQACQSIISSLRTKIRQMGSVENRKPGLVGNATRTRICAKTVQRRLKGARLR